MHKQIIGVPLLCLMLLLACQSEKQQGTPSPTPARGLAQPSVRISDSLEISNSDASDIAFQTVSTIISDSCMPCHNPSALNEVIQRTESADFTEIDNVTRLRILGELKVLQSLIAEGEPLRFTSQEAVEQLMKIKPADIYIRLEKGTMPPSWAPELMEKIDWPNYKKLALDNRIEMLKYAKTFAQEYLP